jgi:hypothetical protein
MYINNTINQGSLWPLELFLFSFVIVIFFRGWEVGGWNTPSDN